MENISIGRKIINKVIHYFEDVRKQYPEITDDMLLEDGAIYYMNAHDGTDFDWFMNGRLCEFMMFYKSTDRGFIKVFVDNDDTISGYLYLNEGLDKGIELNKLRIGDCDALYLASLLNKCADNEMLFDKNIVLLDFDVELNSWDLLSEEEDNENCCANCSNPDSYGGLEGFYCKAKGCFIRGEQHNCEQFLKNR